jgi:antitoxin CptB
LTIAATALGDRSGTAGAAPGMAETRDNRAMTDTDELRRLRWRARRGMKELDLVMLRILDAVSASGNAGDLDVFRRLLEVEDPELWRWVIGKDTPADADFGRLIGAARDAASVDRGR